MATCSGSWWSDDDDDDDDDGKTGPSRDAHQTQLRQVWGQTEPLHRFGRVIYTSVRKCCTVFGVRERVWEYTLVLGRWALELGLVARRQRLRVSGRSPVVPRGRRATPLRPPVRSSSRWSSLAKTLSKTLAVLSCRRRSQ